MIWIKESRFRTVESGPITWVGGDILTYIEAPVAWGLTRGMARVVGVNLVDAVSEGWFSRRDLASMVDACEVCDQSRRCAAYLAVTTRAEALPSFCTNKPQIEALLP